MKARFGWTVWITLSLGAYLFFAPDIWAMDGEAAGARNLRIVGVCVFGMTVWALGIPKAGVGEWIKAALGCWLLMAPSAFGHGGPAAWNAWVVGALMLLVGVGNVPFAPSARLRANVLRHRSRRVTPRDIVGYRGAREPPSPEALSRQIVERSDQIRRTLLGEPSEVEVEMCALGCSACMDDLITLALLIKEEQPISGPVRRMKLGAAYRRATDSLPRTRRALRLRTTSVPSEERSRK